jgi:3-phosphoglycerate kinase
MSKISITISGIVFTGIIFFVFKLLSGFSIDTDGTNRVIDSTAKDLVSPVMDTTELPPDANTQ